ncbi:hypothetical protein ACTFIY_009670 [Dictyostelium cf. discoideum]
MLRGKDKRECLSIIGIVCGLGNSFHFPIVSMFRPSFTSLSIFNKYNCTGNRKRVFGLEVVTVLVNDIGTFTSNNCYIIFRLFLLFSSGTGNIPRSIDQTISRVNTNPDSTTLETEDYSTFQSHIRSIFGPQKARVQVFFLKEHS